VIQTGGVDIQVTDAPSFRIKIGVMAMEPVHAPMWFAVHILKNLPECGAAHRWGCGLVAARRHQIIYAPACCWAMTRRGFLCREGDYIYRLTGGKSAAAGLTVAHPGGLQARGRDTGYATGARCGGHSASPWQGGDSRGDRELPLARSAGTGTPTLAVSYAHG